VSYGQRASETYGTLNSVMLDRKFELGSSSSTCILSPISSHQSDAHHDKGQNSVTQSLSFIVCDLRVKLSEVTQKVQQRVALVSNSG